MQIGQGTYSNVYKARDVTHDKIVAIKKVRFDSGDPESVKFMSREIIILRGLDHPNIIKLQGLITSQTSSSLYLVFEYMEHDLTGLSALPGMKFTEAQVPFVLFYFPRSYRTFFFFQIYIRKQYLDKNSVCFYSILLNPYVLFIFLSDQMLHAAAFNWT